MDMGQKTAGMNRNPGHSLARSQKQRTDVTTAMNKTLEDGNLFEYFSFPSSAWTFNLRRNSSREQLCRDLANRGRNTLFYL